VQLYRQAEAHYLAGRYDEALLALVAGYREDPDPEFIYNIAKVLQRADRPAQALRAYQRYLELDPSGRYRKKAEEKVRLYVDLGTAAESPEPAPGASPHEQALLHYRRAEAHYKRGNYDRALGELGAGFQQEADPEFLYNIGKAHEKAGRPDRAERAYQSYLRLAPQGRFAQKARLRLDALRPAAPMQGERSLAFSLPEQRVNPGERAPRPRWRLALGGVAAGAGLGLLGGGIYALTQDGKCLDEPVPPQQVCNQIYASSGIGLGLSITGAALLVGGAALLILPGPPARPAPRLGLAPGKGE
jgi:tetratricopeptide (TPR) repeat protein